MTLAESYPSLDLSFSPSPLCNHDSVGGRLCPHPQPRHERVGGRRDMFMTPGSSSSQQERELKEPGNLSVERKSAGAGSSKGQQDTLRATGWQCPGEGESRGHEVLALLCLPPCSGRPSLTLGNVHQRANVACHVLLGERRDRTIASGAFYSGGQVRTLVSDLGRRVGPPLLVAAV